MKRFDVHVHNSSVDGSVNRKELLAHLEEADMYGCAVFSNRPKLFGRCDDEADTPEERLDGVLKGCEGTENRLLPVLWVHPDEECTLDLIDEAAERGIAGFKVICNNFYVYEDKSLRMLEKIASYKKPVLFHSGILWSDGESSKYNRPLNWEILCTMPNLRFSLAHCSWPWYDECIALLVNSRTIIPIIRK